MTPPPSAAAPRTMPRRGQLVARSTPAVAPPLRRPSIPRRVSGPATRTRRPAPNTTSPLLRLIDHPLLDGLIRGRRWLVLIALVLMSIVGLEVALLKLNTGIGSQITRAQALGRENAMLGAQVSALEASERIQAVGLSHGMLAAPAGRVRYLPVTHADGSRAADAITLPRAPTGGTLSASRTKAGSGTAAAGSGAAGTSGTAAGGSGAAGTSGSSGSSGTATSASGTAAGDTGSGTGAGGQGTVATAGTGSSSGAGSADTSGAATGPDSGAAAAAGSAGGASGTGSGVAGRP